MKFGVVGIGKWGQKVTKEYIALMNDGLLDSVVICDADNSKLKLFPDAESCNKVDELIGKVDAVHICTPNTSHYEIASRFLRSNTHVLIEKPMAENEDEASKLVEMALSKNLVLQVGHIFRFANIVRAMRDLYLQNKFGEVSCLNLAWTHMLQPIPNSDVIYDLLPHPMDIINFITSEWPTEFVGVGRSVRKKGTIEMCYLQAIYESGKVANVYLSWVSHVRRRYIEIVGSKSSLVGDCAKQEAVIYDGTQNETRVDVEPNNTIREEILNFANTIKNRENQPNSGIIGMQSIQLIKKAQFAVKNRS